VRAFHLPPGVRDFPLEDLEDLEDLGEHGWYVRTADPHGAVDYYSAGAVVLAALAALLAGVSLRLFRNVRRRA
jgi:hypothetical protein